MSLLSEDASVNCPPLLDVMSYLYRKTRMRAFIRTLNVKAWRSILIGLSPHTTKDFEGNETIKVEIDWSNNDDKLANYNNKALNAILNGLDAKQIKLVSSCESTKEALDIF